MSMQLCQKVLFDLSLLWVFVQPVMMNADIRMSQMGAVFFIKDSLPDIIKSNCTGYLNILIPPPRETDKYINIDISGIT